MRSPGWFIRLLRRSLYLMSSWMFSGCLPQVPQPPRPAQTPQASPAAAHTPMPQIEPTHRTEAKIPSRKLPEMIQAAIDAGQTTIRIPEGVYRVKPDNGTHLVFRDLQDITIDATGVEMICTETTRAILIENCINLTLKGLTVDYDPLPFTQGKLIEISGDRKSHVIQLQEGFLPAEQVIASKYIIHTPEGNLRFGNYHNFKTEVLSGNRLRVSGLQTEKGHGERVGDLITISTEAGSGPFVPHAIQLHKSRHTVLEDITLYASPTFGFFETHSSASVYRRCVVDRRYNRLRSLNADGFHSKFAEVGPLLEDCQAYWQGDDGINICGAYHLVMGSGAGRLRVLAKREMDIQPGDPVQLVEANGQPLPHAKVVSVRKTGATRQGDRERLKKIRILWMVKNLLNEEYEIELDRPVSMQAGGVIGSTNRMGNGFVIRGCRFGHIRSRGILVKGSHGLIENNLLDHCAMQAIKIAPEYIWLESGYSENLTVRNNRILNPGAEGILVDSLGPFPIHEGIHILDNRIHSRQLPVMRFRGVASGTCVNNEITGIPEQDAGRVVAVEYSPGLQSQP